MRKSQVGPPNLPVPFPVPAAFIDYSSKAYSHPPHPTDSRPCLAVFLSEKRTTALVLE